MEYITKYNSPVGLLTISSDGKAITGLWIENQKYFANTLSKFQTNENLKIFEEVKNWLNLYFKGQNPQITFALKPKGSAFRQKVWEILLDIPYGQTTTYGEIAKRLKEKGQKASAQAVGGAVGHNPISIIIPCHRVVGHDGSLTGYAGGIQTKLKLLKLEKVNIKEFYIPTKGTAL